MLLDTDDRPKSLYFSPNSNPAKIEIIETKELNRNSNLLEIVEDDYMARSDTNKILRPEFTTIGAEETKVSNASGMGYEGPRMRVLSKEEDGLLLRPENPELLKANSGGATPGQVDFY